MHIGVDPLLQNNRHEAQLQGLNAEKHTNNNNNETERDFPELPFIHFGRCVCSCTNLGNGTPLVHSKQIVIFGYMTHARLHIKKKMWRANPHGELQPWQNSQS